MGANAVGTADVPTLDAFASLPPHDGEGGTQAVTLALVVHVEFDRVGGGGSGA
jgi:hypothetical protein